MAIFLPIEQYLSIRIAHFGSGLLSSSVFALFVLYHCCLASATTTKKNTKGERSLVHVALRGLGMWMQWSERDMQSTKDLTDPNYFLLELVKKMKNSNWSQ